MSRMRAEMSNDSQSPLLEDGTAKDQAQYGTLTRSPSTQSRIEQRSDEEQPPTTEDEPTFNSFRVASLLSVLLLGDFVGSADGTLVYTTAPKVASQFNSLEHASWLATTSTLAVCVSQPLIGKLSDIYGRKHTLLVTYLFFALGNAICGTGESMAQVIVGRGVSGIGGGGMMAMTSIVIGDLVPKREIATWRSYVNVCMMIGRSCGGPIGGWFADAMGWRYPFLIQVALTLMAFILVSINFKTTSEIDEDEPRSASKLKRIDFLGSFLLATSILSGMLLLNLGGKQFAWKSVETIVLAVATLVLGTLFFLVEAYVASEPIFSLHLLRIPDVILSYLMMFFQTCAQAAMLFYVPLYFEVTMRATAAEAGAKMLPSVIANAVGGLVVGIIVKKTGRYKTMLQSAGIFAAIGYVLQLLYWNGNTTFWGSMAISFAGFGCGVMMAATFVSMTAVIKPADLAMATSGMYLMLNTAVVLCLTGTSTILDASLRKLLGERLTGPDSGEIIERVLSDTEYISGLQGSVREVVVDSYVTSLHWTHVVSLICAFLAFAVSNFIKNRQL